MSLGLLYLFFNFVYIVNKCLVIIGCLLIYWEVNLSNKIIILEINLELFDNYWFVSLCGFFDDNIKYFECCLGVEINYCGNFFIIVG